MEIVYKYSWRYFDEPLQNGQINTWIGSDEKTTQQVARELM